MGLYEFFTDENYRNAKLQGLPLDAISNMYNRPLRSLENTDRVATSPVPSYNKDIGLGEPGKGQLIAPIKKPISNPGIPRNIDTTGFEGPESQNAKAGLARLIDKGLDLGAFFSPGSMETIDGRQMMRSPLTARSSGFDERNIGIQPQIARGEQPQVDPKILEINKALEAISMSRHRDPIWYRNVGIIHEDRLNKELSTLQPQPMTTAQQVLKDLDHILNPRFNPANQIGGIESGDLAMAKMQDERAREEKYYNAAPKSVQQLVGPQQEARAPVGISLMDKGKVVQHQYMDVNPSRIPTPEERAFALKESYPYETAAKARTDAARIEVAPHITAAQTGKERLEFDKESGKRNFIAERMTSGISSIISEAQKQGIDFTDPKEAIKVSNAIKILKNSVKEEMKNMGYNVPSNADLTISKPKVGLPPKMPSEAQIQAAMKATKLPREEVIQRMISGGAK